MDSEISASSQSKPVVAGGYRELLIIAIPMVLSSGTQSLMHVFDRVFLTWYDPEAMAAALPAGILFWSCLSLPFGIIMYTNAFVAQYYGARQPQREAASVWQATHLALGCGLLLMLPALWSGQIFEAIGHEAGVIIQEAEYFKWLSLGSVPALLAVALSCFFSGRGQTNVVLYVNVASVLVDLVLDYAMIFGWGPIPRLGIVGAAVSTNIGNLTSVLLYLLLLWRSDAGGQSQFWRNSRLDGPLMRDLLKFGVPSGVQMLIDVAGFTVFMMILGWIGTVELAATNIAFNLNTLAFIPVHGVGVAVSTLVGQRIGEGRPELAATSVHKGFVLAGGIMLAWGIVYLFAPQWLIAPYAYRTQDANFGEVRATVVVLLRFVALYSFFDAMAIVFGSAVRAAGDTVFSMIVTCVCAWGLLVMPTYWTWYSYQGHADRSSLLFWSWVWCSVYVMTLGFVFLARFLGGRWKTMSVIAPANPVVAAVDPTTVS